MQQSRRKLSGEIMLKNFHPSQMRATDMLKANFGELRQPILGALPERTRRHAGLSEEESKQAVQALEDSLPKLREMQAPAAEREIMRLMWGPDGVALIESARDLHREAIARSR